MNKLLCIPLVVLLTASSYPLTAAADAPLSADQARDYANAIERRLDDSGLDMEGLIRENNWNLSQCRKYGCEYILVDGKYEVNL